MGNWTDRFDPETVDEIKRCEVGEGDFLDYKDDCYTTVSGYMN